MRIDRPTLLVLGVATICGWAADWLNLPAGWFLGATLGGLAMALAQGTKLVLPPSANLAAQMLLGVAVSASFTPQTIPILLAAWPAVLLIIGGLLGLSLALGWLVAKFTQIDAMTAILGLLPGGAPAMVALSESLGGDVRQVAVMQYLRLILVIAITSVASGLLIPMSTPAVPRAVEGAALGVLLTIGIGGLGALVGWWLGLPAGAMSGAALFGALAGIAGLPLAPLPSWMLPFAYVLLGIQIGARFDQASLREVASQLPLFIGVTIVLIASSALLGWGVMLLTPLDPISAYLSSVPGGLDAVTVIALSSQADAALVFSIGLLRFLAIMVAAPPIITALYRAFGGTPLRREA